MSEKTNIPELFGSMVFNEAAMERYVPAAALQAWRQCLKNGRPLSLEVANSIADGMKSWALDYGIDACLYRRWDKTFVPDRDVTFVVNSLKELIDVL